MSADAEDQVLITHMGGRGCALPLGDVVEVMRPLPVEPIAGTPGFVLGLAIVRGAPIPVLDTAALFAGSGPRATRWVTVRAAERCVALAVDDVIGVRRIAPTTRSSLPPLLADATDTIDAIAKLDDELVMVLRGTRFVPEDVLRGLQ